MTIKRNMPVHTKPLNYQVEHYDCHVCGWQIDLTDYYVVTKGKYGGRGTCYYHIRCYPPYKRCKEFRISPETYNVNLVDCRAKRYYADTDNHVTYPVYTETYCEESK